MKILHGYREAKNELKDPVVAIGIFDGIHIGHKRVLKRVLTSPQKKSDKVVVTFDPHPQTVLRPKQSLSRIMSLQHRLTILEKMGMDAVVVIKFSDFLAEMTPEDFIHRVLASGIGAKKIYVGNNFHFGRGKTGNIEDFRAIGKKHGIEVKIIPPVKLGRIAVSSTWLRRLISQGRLEKAEKLLRRPVSVLGTVVSGERRGRTFGIPTANIDPHQEVIPPPGVYAVKIDIDGKLFDGVLNIGYKPTFYGRGKQKRKEPEIEVHVINFDGHLYGKDIEIFFIKRLRSEKKFKSIENLKRQIKKDVARAKDLFSDRKILQKIKKYKQIIG
ncbi:MAG: bifunctional riboflavin kinase/FAD synthetase [Candidatus Omnitrophica bacterium]|nr:bifunctional riboflavin kinase/FAD synthetase [Candidatus Omnitrophota bacterium]